ncbi:MAG: hypothetical protein JXL80_04850 [Planctomycetes bacterium]|nr:hypothetical protein [Planctomycetota bacterium]
MKSLPEGWRRRRPYCLWDVWCGAKEFQALMLHEQSYWGIDLVEMQGGDSEHDGPGYLLGDNSWLICEIDADLAEAMGCVQDSAGAYCGYAGPASWWRPGYKDGTQGTPADGVLVGDDRTYHIASHAGNSTLPGDWTEIEDTTTWTAGGIVSGTGLGLKFNVMASFTRHNTADLQDGAVTAELPEEQKGVYNNVNFVLAVYDGSNGGRHKRIWALYGNEGTDQELLWAWDNSASDQRPQMDAADPSVYLPTFRALNSTTQYYNSSSGETGNIETKTYTMYEFGEPLPLNKLKVLWGFKIDDSEPATNWQARGAAVWAATAFASGPRHGPPDPIVSTIEVEPNLIPSHQMEPAVVTVTLMDLYHNMVDDVSDLIAIDVSGTGTSTITFVEEAVPGVYTYEFTNDTPGTKYLEVSVDYWPPDDPIVLSGLGMVVVFDGPYWLKADAGPDQMLEDMDESGDEDVVLDGSASSGQSPIVSYVWSWYGTEIATGETATATLPLGAREIELTVTDDEGFADRDSLGSRSASRVTTRIWCRSTSRAASTSIRCGAPTR